MREGTVEISVRGLCFSYRSGAPGFMAGLNLDIRQGSICALLGPNGSGKTTLLHLFLGLLRPTGGSIEISAVRSDARGKTPKHLVGLVPQEESVPFDLSVFEYVLLGRAPHLGLLEQPGQGDRELAARALETVGIAGLDNRAVPSLSGGERQLAMVARVLVQESRIMLMDEPTPHLDLGNTRRILDLMQVLRDGGRTVIFSTHDPNAASAVADQMVLLKNGGIVCSGNPDQVLTPERIGDVYGIAGVEAITRLDGKPLIVIK